MDFAIPTDRRKENKKREKTDKYLDLTRELKKMWNMRVTAIPMVIDAFGMVPKSLEESLEELEIRVTIEIIKTKALLRLARTLRTVLET